MHTIVKVAERLLGTQALSSVPFRGFELQIIFKFQTVFTSTKDFIEEGTEDSNTATTVFNLSLIPTLNPT